MAVTFTVTNQNNITSTITATDMDDAYQKLGTYTISGHNDIITCSVSGKFDTGLYVGLFEDYFESTTTIDISELDTTNQDTNFASLFMGCESLTTIIGLETLVNSNTTSVANMFQTCLHLESLDLTGWDTSNVTDMQYLFAGCESLFHIYVGDNWSVDNVNMDNYMFSGCINLPNYDGTVDKSKAIPTQIGGYLETSYVPPTPSDHYRIIYRDKDIKVTYYQGDEGDKIYRN